MHRRPLGRGRRLAAFAALIIVVGCFLPWWQFGGDAGLPLRSGNAFEGAGILVFFAALATIALVTLPYATDRPVPVDRGLSYVAIAAIGWIGFLAREIALRQCRRPGVRTVPGRRAGAADDVTRAVALGARPGRPDAGRVRDRRGAPRPLTAALGADRPLSRRGGRLAS